MVFQMLKLSLVPFSSMLELALGVVESKVCAYSTLGNEEKQYFSKSTQPVQVLKQLSPWPGGLLWARLKHLLACEEHLQ